ncbi:hypothetical protein GGR51DRAFT_264758 [Nemania sp. FL0031]|nr:hypothetical protein GGR51DRAFT_264758 [Nemania sp. FL0031]
MEGRVSRSQASPPPLKLSEPKTQEQEQEQVSPATQSPKRQIDSDDDGDDHHHNEHRLKRARLTRKNLTRFNEMGKKKGTQAAAPPSAPQDSTTESTTTKTASTTTSGFAVQAYKNGILGPSSSKPPTNLEEIRKRYIEPRGTPSPTPSVYEDYVDTVATAENEATMTFEVGAHMLKKYDKGYKRALNRAFTGFPKDVGFNNGLSAPQPDFVEGLRMPKFRPFSALEHISGAVLYKNSTESIVLPHLAGEWKGPDGTLNKAMVQSGYDGAALVYARNKALAFLGKSDPPGHAKITTFTTDGTTLNLYAHYATPLEDDTVEYHQYNYASLNLMGSYNEHKNGRKGLRNAQDDALKQSHALRDQLVEHWKQRLVAPKPTAEGALPPVLDGTLGMTNADEDEVSYEILEKPCEPPTPPTSSKPECLSNQGNTSSSVPPSKSLPPADDPVPSSGGRKRKASLSSHGSSPETSRQRKDD